MVQLKQQIFTKSQLPKNKTSQIKSSNLNKNVGCEMIKLLHKLNLKRIYNKFTGQVYEKILNIAINVK